MNNKLVNLPAGVNQYCEKLTLNGRVHAFHLHLYLSACLTRTSVSNSNTLVFPHFLNKQIIPWTWVTLLEKNSLILIILLVYYLSKPLKLWIENQLLLALEGLPGQHESIQAHFARSTILWNHDYQNRICSLTIFVLFVKLF